MTWTKTLVWSAAGVAAVAAVTAGVIIAMPSVQREAAPRTTAPTTTTTTSTSKSVDPHPEKDGRAALNAVTDAIARADNAAYQQLLCSGATVEAKAPLTYPPGARLLGVRQSREFEVIGTLAMALQHDMIVALQPASEWCLLDVVHCPLTQANEVDLEAILEAGNLGDYTDCVERPLRME